MLSESYLSFFFKICLFLKRLFNNSHDGSINPGQPGNNSLVSIGSANDLSPVRRQAII